MVTPLEPNRIHTLPVQIQYHLPYSSHTFTTILPALQQVYIYPAAPSDKGGNSESWGSIYLKTVVQGVVMASPEVLPFGGDVPDLSLYIFDPRETFLRKSRPAHLRPSRPSSPLPGQSPSLGSGSENEQAVWTGKGLVSWALNELGVGKNLITGRLVRSTGFARHSAANEGMNPLEALMCVGKSEEESWGIEVSLGLKDTTNGTLGFAPAHSQAAVISRQPSPVIPISSPVVHASSSNGHHFQRPAHPAVPRRSVPAPHAPVAGPSVPTPQRRLPASTPARPTPQSQPTRVKAVPTTKKKRPTPPSRHLASVDTNSKHASTSKTRHPAAPQANLPFEIPRHVYDNPDLLTKEQAERLIASPLFLDKISQMTGHPLVPKVKREREDEGHLGSVKKPRFSRTDADGESTSKCYNCGRVKSYVWRQMTLDDGNVVTICNACGLYKNRHGHMRPPSMWEGVEDEVKTLRLGGKTPAPQPSSEMDMPATRLDSVFKRTLSAAVDKDAQRIASLRKPSIPRPTQMSTRSGPMTSPPRGSASAAKGVRNTSRTFDTRPASSPGGYALPASDAHPATHSQVTKVEQVEFDPNESPNTVIRRILGTDIPLQSLEMPLSDDGRDTPAHSLDWSATDISTYFDVGSFEMEMSAGPNGARALRSPSPPPPFHRTSSSAASKRRAYTHHHQPSESDKEDDVLSQLFNRTSSIGPLDSSPAPFDFSQLPPSSPPASTHGPSSDIADLELGHSHLLLSSPSSVSPLGVSPIDRNGNRVSPDKKSGLKHSFTPQHEQYQHPQSDNSQQEQGETKSAPPEYQLEDIWSNFKMNDGQGLGMGIGMESSGAVAEHLLGGHQGDTDTDDFMALFNSLTNSQ